MNPKRHTTVVAALTFFLFAALSASAAQQWGVQEIVLEGPSSGNPYVDVSFSATFTQGTQQVIVPGFWDGGGTYRIRFSPPSSGDWSYVTTSATPELNGQTGSFTVTAPAGNNHGPVRVADTYYFKYADGTRYHEFGTTCYAWVHQPDALQDQTIQTLSTSPFNKIRMTIFPKHYAYNNNEPDYFAFLKINGSFDFTRPDTNFWQRLEARILQLQDLGIQADLILWHGYDNWGFSNMGDTNDDRYLRYCIARLSGYRNVWWSLANEFDIIGSKTMDDWDRFFSILYNEDPHQRMRSIHNMSVMYDYTKPWCTHAGIQKWDPENGMSYRANYGKPVIFDESGYEGDIGQIWGHLTGPDMARRFWMATFTGTYAGHGETYQDPNDILWWSKGGILKGTSPSRIQWFEDQMAQAPAFAELTPLGNYTLAKAGQYYMLYVRYTGAKSIQLAATHPSYKVEILDLWNMTVTNLGSVPAGQYNFTASQADVVYRFTPLAPEAPSGFFATTVSSNQINLTWIAVTNAISYNVKRSSVDGGPYTVIANVLVPNYLDGGLTPSTNYYYVVSAVGELEGNNSAQAKGVTGSAYRPRVIISSDFPPTNVCRAGCEAWRTSDPDDVQSMVRFLLYVNEFDVEGLIASSGTHAGIANKNNIKDMLYLYSQVYTNLLQHDLRFPTADTLRAVTFQGRDGTWGQQWPGILGTNMDSEASDAIISIVDGPDPRPVWVCVWGGPREVAQAIYKVKNTRSQAELDTFISKLRIFAIAWQDGTIDWMLDNFPNLFIVYSRSTYIGMFGSDDLNWLNANVRYGHGPLGAVYPPEAVAGSGVIEGDTPSYLHLISAIRGINDPENPAQGGWGGQYARSGTTSHWLDCCGGGTISKWSSQFEDEFAERADWMIPMGLTPAIGVSPAALSVQCASGEAVAPVSLTVYNAGTGTLNYTITNNGASWLSVTPLSGISTDTNSAVTHTVSLVTSNLAVGSYSASLTISSPDATQVTVPVSVRVRNTNSLATLIVDVDFNEGGGATAANMGSAGGSLTVTTPVPSWSTNTPQSGGAYSVDFQTTVGAYYVESPTTYPELGGLTEFTVAGWVNCRSSAMGGGGNRLVTWVNNGGNGVDIVYKSTGGLQVGINTFADSQPLSSTGIITADANAGTNNWRFFAVTYDSTLASGQLKFYFGSNGIPAKLDVAKDYAKGAVGTSIGTLCIGQFNTSSRHYGNDRMFRGLIDQVKIFGSALTLEQIQQIQGLSVAPSSAPVIACTPAALSVQCLQGQDAQSVPLSIYNSGTGTLDYTVTNADEWFSVTPTGGSSTNAADTVSHTVSFLTGDLAPGTYTSSVLISAPGATQTQLAVPITIQVMSTNPMVGVAPAALSAQCLAGQNQSLTLTISNIGSGTLEYTLTNEAAWLAVTPSSGTSTGAGDPHSHTVSITTSNLAPGSYSSSVTISAPSAYQTLVNVHVALQVLSNSPAIGFTPASLSAQCVQGQNGQSLSFSVFNAGTGSLNYTLSNGASWLAVSPSSGSSASSTNLVAHTVSLITSNLTVGSYTSYVYISAQNATQPLLSVPVSVQVVSNSLTPIIDVGFVEGSGTSTANKGSAGGRLTVTTPVPSWSANVPNSGGSYSADFQTTTAAYYVESPTNYPQLAGLTNFTVTGWVNCRSSSTGSGGNRLVTWVNGGGNGVDIVYKNTGGLQVGINSFADNQPLSSTNIITADASAGTNNWRFFAVTYDAGLSSGHLKFYFGSNGIPAALDVARDYSKGAVGPSIGTLCLGQFNTSSRGYGTDRMFRGLIDEVKIFGTALSLDQIRTVQGSEQQVSPSAPVVGVSPATLSAHCQQGQNAQSVSLIVSNTGTGTLTYNLAGAASWLTVVASSGSSTGITDPHTHTVNFTTTNLTPGTYNSTIDITAAGATPSLVSVPVTLQVLSNNPVIAFTPASLSSQCMQGQNGQSLSFSVYNAGTGVLSYTLSNGASWLGVSPASGSSSGSNNLVSHTVSLITSNLAVGSYTDYIFISAPGIAQPLASVPVSVQVFTNSLVPIIDVGFIEGTGTSATNRGTAAGRLTVTTPIPSWSTKVPSVGGSYSIDFQTTNATYFVESPTNYPQLGGLTNFTVTGWVNCRSSTMGAGGNRLVTWVNKNGGNGVDIVYKSDGRLQVGIDTFADNQPSSSAGKISVDSLAGTNNWRFFAVTYDSTLSSGHLKFYFGSNGVPATLDLAANYSAPGIVGTSIGTLCIGQFNTSSRSYGTDRMFRGLIDEVKIFGSALTLSQVQAVQNSESQVLPTAPVIGFSPSSLSTQCLQHQNAQSLSLTVSNAGTGTLTYSLTNGASWLAVSPASGSSTGAADTHLHTLSFATTNLGPGVYSNWVSISAPGIAQPLVYVPVSLVVLSNEPAISFTPSGLSTQCLEGQTPQSMSLSLYNSGTGVLSYSVTNGASWLAITPATGSSTNPADLETHTVSFNAASLTPGVYTSWVSISAPMAVEPLVYVPVSLTVIKAYPVIGFTPDYLATRVRQGQNAQSLPLTVCNTGNGTLAYTVTNGASWLAVSPASGSSLGTNSPVTHTVSLITSNLPPGAYFSWVSVSAPSAAAPLGYVPVAVRVMDYVSTTNYNGNTPLVSYGFDEGSGATTTNSGSLGGYGTLNLYSGYPVFTNRHPFGFALSGNTTAMDFGPYFTPIAGPIAVDRAGNLGTNLVGGFTICGWLNCRSFTVGYGGNRIANCQNGNGGIGFDLVHLDKGALRCGINAWADDLTPTVPQTADGFIGADASASDTNWVFFAVSFDPSLAANNLSYYIGRSNVLATLRTNFSYKGRTTYASVGITNAGPLTIGNANASQTSVRSSGSTTGSNIRVFHGLIDDIKLFGKALTQEEIQATQVGSFGTSTETPGLYLDSLGSNWLMLSWLGSGMHLEESAVLNGSWNTRTNQAGAQLLQPVGNAQFFRLKSP